MVKVDCNKLNEATRFILDEVKRVVDKQNIRVKY